MNWWWVALLLLALLVFGLYLSMTAGRLDRLHKRIDTGRLALDGQLLRRQSVALELAGSGLLDPATSLLVADAAHGARTAPEHDAVARGLAESNLTKALAAALPDREEADALRATEEGRDLVAELDAACRRVELSRRFLNDGVRACRAVRRHRTAQWFRLSGHTPWPETVELDDAMPPGLVLR